LLIGKWVEQERGRAAGLPLKGVCSWLSSSLSVAWSSCLYSFLLKFLQAWWLSPPDLITTVLLSREWCPHPYLLHSLPCSECSLVPFLSPSFLLTLDCQKFIVFTCVYHIHPWLSFIEFTPQFLWLLQITCGGGRLLHPGVVGLLWRCVRNA
jgi:hypothetical protein